MTDLATAQVVAWAEQKELLQEIRRRVFIDEQGVSQEEEWDGRDDDAVHILAVLADGRPVGCGRLLPEGQIGRMAVLRSVRKQGIGRIILDKALAVAREYRLPEVFLHAQTSARNFYHRAGFEAVGGEFIEADTAHIRMTMRLDVQFMPDKEPLPKPKIVPEAPRDPAQPDADNQRQLVQTWDQARWAAEELAARARRRIRIYSPVLTPEVYADRAVVAAVSALARGYANAEVRILVHQPKTIVASPHALLELAKRMSSKISIRTVHADQMANVESYMLSDRRGIYIQSTHLQPHGWVNYNEAVWAKRLDESFDEQWYRGHDDPEMRALSL